MMHTQSHPLPNRWPVRGRHRPRIVNSASTVEALSANRRPSDAVEGAEGRRRPAMRGAPGRQAASATRVPPVECFCYGGGSFTALSGARVHSSVARNKRGCRVVTGTTCFGGGPCPCSHDRGALFGRWSATFQWELELSVYGKFMHDAFDYEYGRVSINIDTVFLLNRRI